MIEPRGYLRTLGPLVRYVAPRVGLFLGIGWAIAGWYLALILGLGVEWWLGPALGVPWIWSAYTAWYFVRRHDAARERAWRIERLERELLDRTSPPVPDNPLSPDYEDPLDGLFPGQP